MVYLLQILCIFALLACGFFARRRGVLSAEGTREMARLLVSLVYPCLIFVSITKLSARDLVAHWPLPAFILVIAATGLALGLTLLKLVPAVKEATARATLFQCLINNYLFLPLPMVMMLYGDYGVALLVFSSVAYEIVLWTVGVFLLSRGASLAARVRAMLGPSFISLWVSLAVVAARDLVAWPEPAALLVEAARVARFGVQTMSQATIALSVFVAGSRMATLHPSAMRRRRSWGVAAIRLLAVPAVVIPLLRVVSLEPAAEGVITLVSIMPCAVISVVFSERFDSDTDLIAGTFLLTHLWALITIPLWLAIAL